MTIRRWTTGLAALAMWACGGDEASPTAPEKVAAAPDFAAKADGALAALPVGRLAGTETHTVAIEAHPLSWRFATFPGTRVRVEARAPAGDLDPMIGVLGPIPARPEAMVAFNDDATPDTFDAAVEVTADAFGAMEVVVGTYGQYHQGVATPGQIELRFTCLEGCSQPMVPLDALLSQFDPAALQGALGQALPALFPEGPTAQHVQAQVDAYLAGDDAPFPVVSMSALSAAEGLLEPPSDPVPPPEPVTFDLGDLLTRGCVVDRPMPAALHPTLPALKRGWLPDYTLDDCTVRHQRDFAEVLNNLALDNGSKVVDGATVYESVQDVFVALIDSGHHVTVQNNRYLANFLALSYEGASIIAPLWIDTGLPTAEGTLAIPAPHSHHTIIVQGPLLDARVEYYMGVSGGVSFRSAETLPLPWVGERTAYTYDSAEDADAVLSLMTLAARLRRVWTDRGAGLPALGYGALGVCNDSTAALEYDAEGTVTIFPLLHPGVDAPAGQVDDIFAALPSDRDALGEAALQRIAQTLPDVGAYLPGLDASLTAAGAR